jgi:hypothetical protein
LSGKTCIFNSLSSIGIFLPIHTSLLNLEGLAEKLIDIRSKLGLSQNEMISRMGIVGEVMREEIFKFERGVRIPPLPVPLGYENTAKTAKIKATSYKQP